MQTCIKALQPRGNIRFDLAREQYKRDYYMKARNNQTLGSGQMVNFH